MNKKALYALIAAPLVVGAAFGLLNRAGPKETIAGPETLTVPDGLQTYRVAGQYMSGLEVVDAPLLELRHDGPLQIMKYQVSEAEYGECVAAKACVPSGAGRAVDLPQTNLNYDDALNYAAWLSEETNQSWRLPSDAEWARAAGSKFFDDALGIEPGTEDPSVRWRQYYEQQFQQRSDADGVLRVRGGFGENEYGISDMSGNVWEWTDTCYDRFDLGEDRMLSSNCGVRVAEGKHRSYMVTFVRDPRGGGCALGLPPDFLGLRLVLDS